MKSPLLIVIVLASMITSCSPRSVRGIRIVVINESEQPIETVQFWEGDPTKQDDTPLATAGPIAPQERREVVLQNRPGESSHSTQVTFENGEQISDQGTYAEGGYTLKKVVTETEITVEYGTY
ncbi:MAG: hypothetical protein AAF528_12860 [Cyanobacteria bacterium P01_C01_bin.121]